jgi:integrase
VAKLTKEFIDKVSPPDKGYKIHWDDTVKGYGLRVMPASRSHKRGKKMFVVQGRVSGKAVIFSVGAMGEITEDQARKKAQRVLQGMRDGIDPRDAKKADDAAKVTLRQVADAYFDRPGRLKDSTKEEMNRHVTKVFAAWQDRPIASITEDDVRKGFREMAEHGLRGQPAPGQAQISMVTLRTLVNYAAGRYKLVDGSPLIKHNPVKALKDEWQGFKPRTRDIAEDKVGAVWHMLAEARLNPKNSDALAGIDLVRFLLLTGTRRMEGAALTWDRVHIDPDPAKCWFHLPDPKNDNPVWLPLSSQAVELLQARERIAGNAFVFPSRSKVGHILDTRSPLEIISKAAGLHLSCHDLRRTFVSIGVATLDIDLYKMELLTNHVPKGITARHYLRTSRLQYLQPEVQRIGNWIEEQGRIAAAVAAGDNVVPIRA